MVGPIDSFGDNSKRIPSQPLLMPQTIGYCVEVCSPNNKRQDSVGERFSGKDKLMGSGVGRVLAVISELTT